MIDTLRCTYRLQFRPEFTLNDAAGIAAYLDRLGISHVYASPITQAAPESAHGYDVVDYLRVNRALGGGQALDRLVRVLKTARMGMVLDMVPNHMAIHPENPWWWDVLENGPSSRYASYFDVEWNPPEARHSDVVLLPVLGDHYGRVLEAGELKIAYEDDAFTVRYYDNVYPVNPGSLEGILSAAAEAAKDDTLMFLAGAFGRLPTSTATDRASATRRYRDKEVLREMLARHVLENPSAEQAIQQVLERVNGDPDALDAFLRRQNYRPAMWKISASELGYRRFFDINSMIGLRMEDENVFQDTHCRVLEWLDEGIIDGLRIDHPDGLRDPDEYFQRLRAAAPHAWLVVEKILEAEEKLPAEWPVHGTTGYDFMNRVNGLFVDPRAEGFLSDFYTRFTGRSADYASLCREKKLRAARYVLGSDLARLTELFLNICERHRSYRDYSRDELRGALEEMAACLPVYRTYVRPDDEHPETGERGVVRDTDREHITQAGECAKTQRPDLDPRLFDFFCDLLLLRVRGPLEAEFVERFQQFTGPVMAKGAEDTSFYVFNRFVSLNEVGGDPSRFGWSAEEFHAACQETQAHWPYSMLSTSTHDTKRGEDVRARLNVISELPGPWSEAVRRWAEINEKYRVPAGPPIDPLAISGEDPDERWPDRNTEYLFYQTAVGAWPLEEERALEYMQKACREAKEFTTWTAPNERYEEAVANFVRGALRDRRFVADLETFVGQTLVAGRINSLAQALLKLTTPGIPDIYQGSELWNLSLVDPDNRRPVDYDRRRKLLDGLYDDTPPERIWARVEEGLPKLWVTRQSLALRRRRPDLFGPHSSYTPLRVEGPLGARPAARAQAGKAGDKQPTGEKLPTAGKVERAAAEPPAPKTTALPDAGTMETTDPALREALRGTAADPQGALADEDGAPEAQPAAYAEEELLVAVTGPAPQPAALAFLRGEKVAVVVPRLVTQFRDRWHEITVELPEGVWRNQFTQQAHPGGRVSLGELLARFPVALLEKM